ncbi:MAG: helix-turn-helix domain-containing protein [Oscillospiraceae bacterium]|nr:helix-turn-helix domain-containing protein [Oscillospiraceae bacterium]
MEENIHLPKNPSPYVKDGYIWIGATPNEFVQKSGFYFLSLGKFDTVRGYGIRRDYFDGYLFVFTENGEGIVSTEEIEFKTYKNHAFLIDCRKPHGYRTQDKWNFRWIHIDGCGIDFIYEQLQTLSPTGAVIDDPEVLIGLFNDIQKSAVNNYSLSVAKQGRDIHNALYQLVSSAQNAINLKPAFLDVFSYIDKNYDKHISVDILAKTAHMSKYHFTRQFKKATGHSPYNYITNYRINCSKALLTATDKPINEISLLCGFLSESNYICHFKKQVGTTPDRYRASQSVL